MLLVKSRNTWVECPELISLVRAGAELVKSVTSTPLDDDVALRRSFRRPPTTLTTILATMVATMLETTLLRRSKHLYIFEYVSNLNPAGAYMI